MSFANISQVAPRVVMSLIYIPTRFSYPVFTSCVSMTYPNTEQKQDNYVCKFLEKPWTWNLPFIDEGQ